MKRRLAIFAIVLTTAGTTSTILATASTVPAGATTTCSTVTNKFRVDPAPAPLTASGTVVKTFTGRCLVPSASYRFQDPACGGFGTVINTDLSGAVSDIAPLTGCTPGIYYTTLTENFGAHKVYLVKERLTSPVSCAPGSAPTIDALPHNAPRVHGNTVAQTIVGECYPAFATVNVNFTACGGSVTPATADAYGRFYLDFLSGACRASGAFPITVTSTYPPVGAILARGTQLIDP